MSDDEIRQTYQINYGHGSALEFRVDPSRVVWEHYGPDPVADVAAAVRQALGSPLDFPALAQAVIPDDRVVIAAEPDTPGLPVVLSEIWSVLSDRGIPAENVLIAQPAGSTDPRSLMSAADTDRLQWLAHDPEDRNELAYLASTTSGERIELARALTDADVVISTGRMGFDPILGYRGTNSAFYPALSTSAAITKARGQGHVELEPEDSRPLRQVVDEVGWLLGTQFTVQTLPSARNGVAAVVAGAVESVFRRGRELLTADFLATPDERPEVVVVSVGEDAGGHGWRQIAAAIATARRLVARDGHIVVLSELNEPCGPGLEILRQVEAPADAMKPLRLDAPADLIAATQIANAVQWAQVSILSQLDESLPSDLFLSGVDGAADAVALIEQSEGAIAMISDAQNVHGRIND